MNAVVIDTNVWIEFFRGRKLGSVERALYDGMVVLPPIVLAELLSGVQRKAQFKQLKEVLDDIPLHPTPREHWQAVGVLRQKLAQRGIALSTPDAHIAQCTLEAGGYLLSDDRIFSKIGPLVGLRVEKMRHLTSG